MNTQLGLHATRQPSELLTQQVGLETLVYNERTHQAFCLNPIAGEVFRHFDGVQTNAQIAAAASIALGTPVTEGAVLFAIAELRGNGLIAPEPQSPAAPIPTRRDLMRQIGAGAIVMLPAVAVVMAPRAAQAYNGCVNCNVERGNPSVRPAPSKASRQSDSNFLQPSTTTDSDDDVRKRRQKNGEIFVP